MRKPLVILALSLVFARGAAAETPQVVGGQPVSPGQFPFLVQVWTPAGNGSYYTCTGSLIAPRWVLTAAHCGEEGAPQFVSIGDVTPNNSIGVSVQSLPVAKWVPHPQYNPGTKQNDIALIQLSADARNYPPTRDGQVLYTPDVIGLGTQPGNTASGIGNVGFAGFGLTQPDPQGQPPQFAYWAVGPTSPAATCSSLGRNLNPTLQLCYGPYPNTCQGDSGGPVFQVAGESFVQMAIPSYNAGPALCGVAPSVATYVPGYVTWINQQINGSSPGGTCTPSSTRLCLLNNRFSVTLRWNDGSGFRDALVADPKANSAGSGAGLFYFYSEDPSNWEVLVKMIDACGGGNFWLLGSASTGFGWELTVRDEKAGGTKTYTKPLNGQASGIADFSAFQTCGQ